jgi:hypothetical protein
LPRPSSEGGEVVAALNCAAVSNGPDRKPLILRFAGQNGYEEYVKARADDVADTGACGSSGTNNGSWNTGGKIVGTLLCYPDEAYYRITWTYDAARVVVYSEIIDYPANRTALFNWWRNSVLLFD